VVECDLAKVEVAGSNPVSRSNPKFLDSATLENEVAFGMGTAHNTFRSRPV
jgi:hypothetical protein